MDHRDRAALAAYLISACIVLIGLIAGFAYAVWLDDTR